MCPRNLYMGTSPLRKHLFLGPYSTCRSTWIPRLYENASQENAPDSSPCVFLIQYRGTSLIRNSSVLGPYSRAVSRALWWPVGRGRGSYERGTPVPESLQHAQFLLQKRVRGPIKSTWGSIPLTKEGTWPYKVNLGFNSTCKRGFWVI